jgi:hypothetical protein
MNQDFEVKSQVKKILEIVEQIAPGKLVELRIPPCSAIQCVAGGTHRRGTPPNVVEMGVETLFKISENPTQWQKLYDLGLISASGANSKIAFLFLEVSKLMKSEI